MKTRHVIILMLLMPGFAALANKPHIRFRLMWHGQPLQPGQSYGIGNPKDTLQLETIRFYVSDVGFYNNNKLVAAATQKHYLMDAELPESLVIDCKRKTKQPANTLRFAIGVDSATNESGARSGPLDPIHGMYWTWQSGYINFKLEGSSTLCNTRLHRFQLHIGGYQQPYNTFQRIILPIGDNETTTIDVELDKFMEQINLQQNSEVMSPGAMALQMANSFSTIFKAAE